uniref:Uncharacterized protein n=1 Tax=Cacopsylla melanoneura TaxID=428564 RepID=A0A8D8SVE6_9HEMI
MKCKGSVKICNPMLCNPCALMWKGDRPLGSNSKFKRKPRGPKITFDTIERELNQMASCYERKRQERLCRIPQEIKECIKEERCCFPPPTCVDYFYDQFLTNLEEDRKLKKKMAVWSCKSRALAKKGPCSTPNCPICKPSCCNQRDQENCGDAYENPWQEIIDRCRGSQQYMNRRKNNCTKQPSHWNKPQYNQSMNSNQCQSMRSQKYQGHQLKINPCCSKTPCCCKKNLNQLCGGGYPCK